MIPENRLRRNPGRAQDGEKRNKNWEIPTTSSGRLRRLSDTHDHLTSNELKPGAKVWYDDQRQVPRQIYDGEETVCYVAEAGASNGTESS